MSDDRQHPLNRVPLRRTDAPSTPEASAAAVSAFAQAAEEDAAEARAAGTAAIEEEPEKPAEKPQPRLDEAELEALAQFRALMDASQLNAAEIAAQIEDLKRLQERNSQIEARLKPMSLGDLLLQKCLRQQVPISEGHGSLGEDDYEPPLTLTFRTIASDVEIDAGEAGLRFAREWADTGSLQVNQDFIFRVATLVCGLEDLCGGAWPAGKLHALPASKKDEREKRIEAIIEEIRGAMVFPVQLLNEFADQQRLFTARVRKLLQDTGYVRQEAGNS